MPAVGAAGACEAAFNEAMTDLGGTLHAVRFTT